MIPVKQIVGSMRFALKDMQGVEISDFELVEAINQAAWLLYSRISEQFVSVGLKKKTLIVDESGEAALPTDFLKVHQVGMSDEGVAEPTTYYINYGKYRISGETFYAPEGAYGFEYYYVPARVSSLNDFLDVPQSMLVYVAKIAVAMLQNDLASAEQIVQSCVNSLTAREISHFEDTGPVQIFGGRL